MQHDSFALLADGSLTLELDVRCLPLMGTWLPLNARSSRHHPKSDTARVVVSAASTDPPDPPSSPATLHIGDVRAWIDDEHEIAQLMGSAGVHGMVELPRRHARLEVPTHAEPAAAADLQPMLTISTALLLGRSGGILLHAGAVVADDGRAWLVVGDARSGKSTLCISLAVSGWALLSDDQIVIRRRSAGPPSVEAWLRPLHLDEGWDLRRPTGRRRTLAAAALGLEIATGPIEIAGTLHTSVAVAEPTTASLPSAGEAFVGLVRQSPWVLADRAAAPAIVRRLSTLAQLPRCRLVLGPDTFGRPAAVRAVLERALTGHGRA